MYGDGRTRHNIQRVPVVRLGWLAPARQKLHKYVMMQEASKIHLLEYGSEDQSSHHGNSRHYDTGSSAVVWIARAGAGSSAVVWIESAGAGSSAVIWIERARAAIFWQCDTTGIGIQLTCHIVQGDIYGSIIVMVHIQTASNIFNCFFEIGFTRACAVKFIYSVAEAFGSTKDHGEGIHITSIALLSTDI